MRVLVLTGHDWALLNYRGPLLRALVAAGHEVLAAAPLENPGVVAKFATMGIRFVPVPMVRQGMNPVRDIFSLLALRRMLAREKPDVLLSYAIKSVIYGSLAARWSGVPKIYALIVGLGASFHRSGISGAVLKAVVTQMYKAGGRCCDHVFVQNREIGEFFARKQITRPERISVVAGSGVDTDHFAAFPLPEGPPVFVFVGRLLRDKGVGEFVAAARRVKVRMPHARFVLIGDTDGNPASFLSADVDAWRREGVVEARGFAEDVRPALRDSTIFVLPSYHEGVPRSTLEALAIGRPVVTTDTIGCRETVLGAVIDPTLGRGIKRGRNGFLVPVRMDEPLAKAMEALGSDWQLIQQMARESRKLAETVFEVGKVNAAMLEAMGLQAAMPTAKIEAR